jgi:hypothetical protein
MRKVSRKDAKTPSFFAPLRLGASFSSFILPRSFFVSSFIIPPSFFSERTAAVPWRAGSEDGCRNSL